MIRRMNKVFNVQRLRAPQRNPVKCRTNQLISGASTCPPTPSSRPYDIWVLGQLRPPVCRQQKKSRTSVATYTSGAKNSTHSYQPYRLAAQSTSIFLGLTSQMADVPSWFSLALILLCTHLARGFSVASPFGLSVARTPALPDLYEASVPELQAGLDAGLFTSVDLIKVSCVPSGWLDNI